MFSLFYLNLNLNFPEMSILLFIISFYIVWLINSIYETLCEFLRLKPFCFLNLFHNCSNDSNFILFKYYI